MKIVALNAFLFFFNFFVVYYPITYTYCVQKICAVRTTVTFVGQMLKKIWDISFWSVP